MLSKTPPEAHEVVGTTPFARWALYYEPAPAEVAQALHQLATAIGSSRTCVV